MKSKSQRTLCTVGLLALILAPIAHGQQFSPWLAPVNLGPTVNSINGDFFPAISKDGLSLYFTAPSCGSTPFPGCRPGYGGFDIFVSQRERVTDLWSPPQNLGPTINTAANEGAPSLSIDGHAMYFASDQLGSFGGNDIYVTRRHNKRDDFGWQPAENLGGGVNSTADEAGPAIFEDDETGIVTLFFDSNRAGGPGPQTTNPAHNGNDIWASTLHADGTFGPAVLVAELSTPYFDRKPAIRPDGLEIIFSSNRPGSSSTLLDLWVATRGSTAELWSTPTPLVSETDLVGAVNSAANDAGGALSFDGTTLYFQSDRSPGGFGAYDLYVTTRSKIKKEHDE